MLLPDQPPGGDPQARPFHVLPFGDDVTALDAAEESSKRVIEHGQTRFRDDDALGYQPADNLITLGIDHALLCQLDKH